MMIGFLSCDRREGFSSLPAILFIGGLLVQIAIAMAFLLYVFSNTTFTVRFRAEALAAARAGIEDGIITIIRNKDCPTIGCTSPYTVTVGGRTATVTLCKDTCAGVGKTQIDSIGQAVTEKRFLRAILSIDSTTGAVTTESIQELPL